MQLNIIVNFGGPRNLNEVEAFLKSLLCDQDVIRSRLPAWIHCLLFSSIAKKRAKVISKDYEMIGGKSPIFEDTEAVAQKLREKYFKNILTFHRYIPDTHQQFYKELESIDCDEILIFPMFPQFSYATTGSIARFFSNNVCGRILNKMRWIKSYAGHPAYIHCMQACIRDFLNERNLKEEETVLFFSPHGLPKKFICYGDIYQSECQLSYNKIMAAFPKAKSLVAYQSKFGKGEWIRPYTIDESEKVETWAKGHRNVVFIPLSFTSDHIETLFEIEQQYMPVILKKGYNVYRCPALNQRPDWIEAISRIMADADLCGTQMLIAQQLKTCCSSCSPTCCPCKTNAALKT